MKIKLRRYPMSEKLDFYKFKMALFYNGEPEDFLLFVWNFKMTINAPVTLADNTKLQYISTILRE